MKKAYISIGSNMGDRLQNLRQALEILPDGNNITVQEISAIYETAPVGGPQQGHFLNACAGLLTDLSPTRLLAGMLKTEDQMGRVRKEKWGPRVIDLDLLVYEGIIFKSPLLDLPHPLLCERDFVLVPLADIAPALIIPGRNESVAEILGKRGKSAEITLYKEAGWHLG